MSLCLQWEFGRYLAVQAVELSSTGAGWVGSCGDRPSGGGGAKSEHGEAGEVGGGGEEVEVGVDFRLPADTGSAAAVTPAHEVAELAFNLGSVGPVVGLPVRIGLALTGACEGGFELADADGAAPGGVSALVAQWTAGAVLGEGGD